MIDKIISNSVTQTISIPKPHMCRKKCGKPASIRSMKEGKTIYWCARCYQQTLPVKRVPKFIP